LRWRPDWIYASDVLACPIAWLCSLLPGRRVLYHEHDTPMPNPTRWFPKACLAARRRLARRAALCVLPNATRARRFCEQTGIRHVHCVWNCPARDEIGPPRAESDGQEVWLLYHGSITPAQLPPMILDALCQLPDWVKLRVIGYQTAGHPRYVEELREMASKLGVAHRFDFLGSVPTRRELLNWCGRSDIGLALFAKQGLQPMCGASNKPFDYLARGCALLVTDLPEWRRMYVDPGYALACDPHDARSIASAVRRLLEHREKTRAMGERGRQRITTDWNYETQFDPVLARIEQSSLLRRTDQIIETHPVQYHAPVYRELQTRFGIPVTAIYGSDFSLQGYEDQEFGTTFAWDTDLLRGYGARFLSRSANGGARSAERTSTRGLRRLFRELSPAAVLVTGYSPRFYCEALWWAMRSGRPLLFRAETTDHARSRGVLKRWSRDGLLRWLYRRCRALLYVGRHSLQHYRRLRCPEEKLFFSPYCVDTSTFAFDEESRRRLRPAVRAELGLAPGWSVILFSGKLVARKGPDMVLEAIRGLPEAQQNRTVVVFLGDGELRETLRDSAGREPAIRTRFVGFQNQSRLSRYYHAADVLVLPSRRLETWGLVVNEALHHGLPCVVSDQVGCAPDLVVPQATGERFPAGCRGSLTAALWRVTCLVGRADVRECCRRQVAAYSVRAAAEGIARAYQRVAHI
jgi:glycosyltransferase involved in cell wall biosynthesis